MMLSIESTDSHRLLNVSLADRECVRHLGARLNETGDWIVPQGLPLDPFAAWLSHQRASSFGVLVAKLWCVHCANLTRVVGLMLPPGHERLLFRGDGTQRWVRHDQSFFVPRFLQYLPNDVIGHLQEFNPNFKRGTQENWGELHQNHCEHCGALHHDRELHRDVEGTFDPSLIATTAIALHVVAQPFYGRSGDGIESDHLAKSRSSLSPLRRRAHETQLQRSAA